MDWYKLLCIIGAGVLLGAVVEVFHFRRDGRMHQLMSDAEGPRHFTDFAGYTHLNGALAMRRIISQPRAKRKPKE